MKIILAALAVLAVSACATCARHPVACSVAGTVLAGSIVATIEANRGRTNGAPDLCHAVGPDGRSMAIVGACAR